MSTWAKLVVDCNRDGDLNMARMIAARIIAASIKDSSESAVTQLTASDN